MKPPQKIPHLRRAGRLRLAFPSSTPAPADPCFTSIQGIYREHI